ncbi:MAG: hypothetical protein FWC78_00460 [Defluviitaleaceae bacterium]|nr:hypothetical protein [Defluviitaleaceae bacterium]
MKKLLLLFTITIIALVGCGRAEPVEVLQPIYDFAETPTPYQPASPAAVGPTI